MGLSREERVEAGLNPDGSLSMAIRLRRLAILAEAARLALKAEARP